MNTELTKTKKLKVDGNGDVRFNRVPIQLAPHLTPVAYKLMDWMLYRDVLNKWYLRIEKCRTDTGLSKDTITKLWIEWTKCGFVTQDESHHYHFLYDEWLTFYKDRIDGVSLEISQNKEGTYSFPKQGNTDDQISQNKEVDFPKQGNRFPKTRKSISQNKEGTFPKQGRYNKEQ